MRADAKKNYEHILTVAREIILKDGAQASLRDIARTAEVGLGTLYRHFPNRDALLETLLRSRFDELTMTANELKSAIAPDEALISWLHEVVICARSYQGIITAMVTAMDDEDSALHNSCVTMRKEGTVLLVHAQNKGLIRADMDGTDLFSLAAALAWLGEQPASALRSEHLFNIISGALLTKRDE